MCLIGAKQGYENGSEIKMINFDKADFFWKIVQLFTLVMALVG